MRVLVEEGPRWDNNEERERCAAETDVHCLVDILRDEAGEEGYDTHDREQAIGDVLGEPLALEVLHQARCQLDGVVWNASGDWAYNLAFVDGSRLVENLVHGCTRGWCGQRCM